MDTPRPLRQTLEATQQSGLYFIGEVVDVTGWLGGYNFQWAWATPSPARRGWRRSCKDLASLKASRLMLIHITGAAGPELPLGVALSPTSGRRPSSGHRRLLLAAHGAAPTPTDALSNGGRSCWQPWGEVGIPWCPDRSWAGAMNRKMPLT